VSVVTKDLLKAEIDKVPDQNLGILYKIVRAFEDPAEDVGRLYQIVDELVRRGVTLEQARREFERQFIVASLKSNRPRFQPDDAVSWKAWIAATYGSMGDAPIERGEQGSYEVREPFE
jgi:hypothetical protein